MWGRSVEFRDRAEAGRRLGEAVAGLSLERPIVLGLARGGVAVASEVARVLGAPLDVVVVRKLGAPFQPELALGAVVNGERPHVERNEAVIRRVGVSEEELSGIERREIELLREREASYRSSRAPIDLEGRTVVLVDDGIATGSSTRAAIASLRGGGSARVVLAVPVAPAEAVRSLATEVDEVVCLHAPEMFGAVGQFYGDFTQTSDGDVRALLAEAAARCDGGGE
jgi:predicted phosphoribosyltransferase